ncbi:MAG: hypothetical protein ACXWKX_09210 [Caulobacteraceae bacterium]
MIGKIAAAHARIVPNFTLSWRDTSASWALEPVRRASEGVRRLVLPAGRTSAFDIIAPAAALGALTVEFARQPWPASDLSLELADERGAVLGRWLTAAPAIQSGGAVCVADFDGLRFEPGARYTVRLSAAAGLPFASVTLRGCHDQGRGLAFHSRLLRLSGERIRPPPAPRVDWARPVVVFPAGATGVRAGLELLSRAFPGASFASVVLDGLDATWPAVADAEAVVLAGAPMTDGQRPIYDQLCFELYRRGVCTIALDAEAVSPWPLSGGSVDRLNRRAEADRQRCRFILRGGEPPRLVRSRDPGRPWASAPLLGESDTLRRLVDLARQEAAPSVSVVVLADGPALGLVEALERLRAQSWPDIRVVVAVPEGRKADRDAATAAIEAVFGHARDGRAVLVEGPADPVERFVRAAEAEPADIHLLLDGPWLANRDFVAAHVFEHLDPGVRTVAGPPVVRAKPGERQVLTAALDHDPEALRRLAAPDDPVQPDSFVNLGRAPFSIKGGASALAGGPSSAAEPGPAWRRIAAGYRLYLDGERIQYTDRALALAPEEAPPAAPLAPAPAAWLATLDEDFGLTARRWLASIGAPGLAPAPAAPFVSRRPARALRVLSYRWHVAHQYELYKLPHQFTLATDAGENGMINSWDFDHRPLRPNVRFAPASQLDPAEFDVAIAHFDENVLAPELCNGEVTQAWGDPFRWLMSLPLPKVAICHGTPQFIGQYGLDPGRKARFEVHEGERARLAAFVKDALVVCNSHQAEAEWGFARSQVIWHGFDPNEFPPGKGDLDVLALGGDWKRPHYRGAWEEMEVRSRLNPEIRVETADHAGGACEIRGGNPYALARFRGYAARLGRFKAYLNTTLRSPMPRSRGEAMMTGAAPVCLDNHDVSLFIENGVNGFYSKDSAELADFLNHLCRNEASARRISAAARRTALDMFNHDRYLAAWAELLERTAR